MTLVCTELHKSYVFCCFFFFLVGIFAISSSRDSISSIPEITTPTRQGGSYDT